MALLTYGFTSVDSLNTDSVGIYDTTVNTGLAQVTNVGAIEGYGLTAHFNGATDYVMSPVPATLSDNSTRSCSVWIYSTVSGTDQKILSTDTGTGVTIFQKRSDDTISVQTQSSAVTSTSTITSNTWYHVAFTYNGSNTVKIYINGVLESTGSFAMDLSTIDMKYVGSRNAIQYFEGNMIDFRVYGSELDSTAMATLYSDGPTFSLIFITMYSHASNITWNSVSGATTYTLVTKNSSGEIIETQTGLTVEEENVYNLDDGSTYDFTVYSNLDDVNPVYESLSNLTPTVDTSSTNDLITFVSNDLTLINATNVSELDPFLKENLSTGDKIQARIIVGNSIFLDKTLVFVQESETISVDDFPSVLTPFISGSVASDVALGTEAMSFDETANTVTVQASTYSIGDTFILDGKKVRVSELN